MQNFLTACRRGARMSWQFGILPLQIVLVIFSMVSLVTAPWTLAAIDNTFWKIFVQALAFCVLFTTLLSIGLMPYFGQREITKDYERARDGLTNNLYEAKKEIEILKQENTSLRQHLEKDK